jgi:SAM-dependent methyltransferase
MWRSVTGHAAQVAICSGWQGGPAHEMEPDYGIVRAIDQYGPILDFGCGIGRNTFLLASRSCLVVAYDFPNMIEQLCEDWRFGNFTNILGSSDWEDIRLGKFDAVLASICFQHIHPDDLRVYLKDLLGMTGHLYVRSRVCNDFEDTTPMLPIYEEHWKVERVIHTGGLKTLEHIREAGKLEHYSIELTPR